MAYKSYEDLIRGKFIRKVLDEEGDNYLKRQERTIRNRLNERTGTLLKKRYIFFQGDNKMTIQFPAYLRFLEIRKRSLKLYNKPSMRMYGRIAERVQYDFTEQTQKKLREWNMDLSKYGVPYAK